MIRFPARARSRMVRPAAAAAVGVLVLAGCGGDDDVAQEVDEIVQDLEDLSGSTVPNDDGDSDNGDDGDDGDLGVVPPQRILPSESEVAAGFVEVPADCASPDGYAAPLALAVPEGWEARGLGRGGGSPLSGSLDLTFSTPEGDVVIEMEHDSVGPDDTVLVEGEPFESFDYDYESFSSSGDSGSGTITFDSVADVAVGDQEVELWVADQAQDPDFLSTTEYKARVRTADLTNPAPGDEDGLTPASMVLSVSHDAESTDLSTEDVAGIVAGLALPDCTWDLEVARLELTFNEDLDGDGAVATAQDLIGG